MLNKNNTSMSARQLLTTSYNRARSDLLFVVIFTAINVFFAATASNTYFLFSAILPYYVAMEGAYLTGRFPAEYYEPGTEFYPDTVFYICVAISVALIIGYLLCFLFSSKGRYGWLIAGLVLFIADTLAMFAIYGITSEMIVDIIFHVLVIVILIFGIAKGIKLKNLLSENDIYQPEI